MKTSVASLFPCVAVGARAPEHLGSERARKRVQIRVQRRFEACVKRCEARFGSFERRHWGALEATEASLERLQRPRWGALRARQARFGSFQRPHWVPAGGLNQVVSGGRS